MVSMFKVSKGSIDAVVYAIAKGFRPAEIVRLQEENQVKGEALRMMRDKHIPFSEALYRVKKANAVLEKGAQQERELMKAKKVYHKMYKLFRMSQKTEQEQIEFKHKYAPFEPRRQEPTLLQPIDLRGKEDFSPSEQKRIADENRVELSAWIAKDDERTENSHDGYAWISRETAIEQSRQGEVTTKTTTHNAADTLNKDNSQNDSQNSQLNASNVRRLEAEFDRDSSPKKSKRSSPKTHPAKNTIKALREQTVSKKKLEQLRDIELQLQHNEEQESSLKSCDEDEDIIYDDYNQPVDVGQNLKASPLLRKFMSEGVRCEDGKIIKTGKDEETVSVPSYDEGLLWGDTNVTGVKKDLRNLSGVQCAKTRGWTHTYASDYESVARRVLPEPACMKHKQGEADPALITMDTSATAGLNDPEGMDFNTAHVIYSTSTCLRMGPEYLRESSTK
jgi:hypothetical protein